jgi:hypothetical protein
VCPLEANAPFVRAVHFGRPAIFNTDNRWPHQALGSRLPMAASREGISGGLLETAVDMTPRLDDAKALSKPHNTNNKLRLDLREKRAAKNPINKPVRVVHAWVHFMLRTRPISVVGSYMSSTIFTPRASNTFQPIVGGEAGKAVNVSASAFISQFSPATS